jgi:hypothetical protein
MMVVSQDCYRIFTIPVTSKKFVGGNVVVRYCIIKNKGTDVKEYSFEEGNSLYVRLVATSGINRDRIFYAIPYHGKTINEVEIKRGVSCDGTAR